MKILKWLFIVILIIIVAALIIAAFLPAHVNVSAETTVKKPAMQLFHSVATFEDRAEWDPWVTTDSTAKVTIAPNDRYVGSTYEWDGEVIKTGRVVVDSIDYGKFIKSKITFGNDEDESVVTWSFEENPDGTDVTWSFESDLKYPVGRLYMAIGKGMLQESLQNGLENLKVHFENKDTYISSLSEINEAVIPAMNAIVSEASGTMGEIMPKFDKLFTDAYNAVLEQGLELAGTGFGYYYNYDEDNQTVSVQCGFPVASRGKSTDLVIARSFPEIRALKAVHTGPYEEFEVSYGKMMKYVQDNGIDITWEAFEFYLTEPGSEPLTSLWKTELYFPLK